VRSLSHQIGSNVRNDRKIFAFSTIWVNFLAGAIFQKANILSVFLDIFTSFFSRVHGTASKKNGCDGAHIFPYIITRSSAIMAESTMIHRSSKNAPQTNQTTCIPSLARQRSGSWNTSRTPANKIFNSPT
jgi:hypothetical protein